MDGIEAVAALHGTLARRDTPEHVAGLVLAALPDGAPPALRDHLGRAASGSTRARHGWSSMPGEFKAPEPMDRQLLKAHELAEEFLAERLPGSEDTEALGAFVEAFSRMIGREPGKGDWKRDRLDAAARAERLPGLSRRRYLKLFRLAGRLEDRLARLRLAESRYRLLLVGKGGLSHALVPGDLGGHLPTAAFVAYHAAQTKRRSVFTDGPQAGAFDTVASALLAWCLSDPDTRWEAVAHVFPREDVLARLDDAAKARLVGKWYAVLDETAEHLRDLASRTEVDLATMVVRRGNDSSTWNLLAGAWNRSRDGWVALASALGMDQLLDAMLPGKVMRLMAADVVSWHGRGGGAVHPDTKVWAALPKPWEALRGEAPCGRAEVEAACRRYGVDPAKSGWSAPRPRTEVAAWRATPELVHGVEVANPHLADAMRRLGYFSGKGTSLAAAG